MDEDLLCPNCLAISQSEKTGLTCGHVFCHVCLAQWRKRKTECPICTEPLTPPPKDDQSRFPPGWLSSMANTNLCSICYYPPTQRSILFCGHEFCSNCLVFLVRNESGASCFICFRNFTYLDYEGRRFHITDLLKRIQEGASIPETICED